MNAERYTEINGKTIEEYYWAGKLVVYVNNFKFDGTYEEACAAVKRSEDTE